MLRWAFPATSICKSVYFIFSTLFVLSFLTAVMAPPTHRAGRRDSNLMADQAGQLYDAGDFTGDYQYLADTPSRAYPRRRNANRLPKRPPLIPLQQPIPTEQFDEPHPEVPAPESAQNMESRVHELEREIHELENESKKPAPVVKANLSYNLHWKHYKNLSDEDTMELRYIAANTRYGKTFYFLFFYITPVTCGVLLLYLAVTLYWTKCWFWKLVPPHRFYQFERYEIEKEENEADLAPLMKRPIDAYEEAEAARTQYMSGEPTTLPRDPETTDDEEFSNMTRPKRKPKRGAYPPTDEPISSTEHEAEERGGRSGKSKRHNPLHKLKKLRHQLK